MSRFDATLLPGPPLSQALWNALPLPSWSVTADGAVTEVNAAWVAYTGLTREQTQGDGWVTAMLPDDIARVRERWQHARAAGESYEIAFRLRRAADGAYRRHQVWITPLHDAANELVGWLATALDVEERTQTEEQRDRLLTEVQTARSWLQQVLDALPEGLLLADRTGQVVLRNRVAQQMLGDAVAQHVPLREHESGAAPGVRRLDGTPYPVAERPLQRALQRGETVRGSRHLMRRADIGQEAPVLVNAAPLRDAGGTITGAVAVFQDISALRDLEQTQEEFLSSAAHDLKTPLTAIRGHTGLARLELARVPAAAATVRRLEQIEAGTLRMARLIDELVDVALIQMGAALELDLEPVDLVALVRGVVAQQADLSAHPIRVTTELPEVWAMVDEARIERVVSNLLSNAVKYSPHGEAIVVRVARADGAPVPVAVIAVQDQGVGIPPDDLPHIFERFRRAENVVGRVAGTGIGLASVQQIVAQHGGTIQVESVLGAGATFTVQLPLAATGASTTQSGTEAAPRDGGRQRGHRRKDR